MPIQHHEPQAALRDSVDSPESFSPISNLVCCIREPLRLGTAPSGNALVAMPSLKVEGWHSAVKAAVQAPLQQRQ